MGRWTRPAWSRGGLWNDRAADDPSVPPVVLMSGRPMGYVEAFARMIGVSYPCIFENGCGMYRRDGGLGREYAFHPVLAADPSAEESVRRLSEYLDENVIGPTGCGKILGKKYAISLTPCSDDSVDDLLAAVAGLPPELTNGFYVTRSMTVVDITPARVNKGPGLDWLVEVIRRDFLNDLVGVNVLGIGDSWADLPFLEKCGYSAAPANAAPAVRESVDYVSRLCDINGVLEVVAGAAAHNRRLVSPGKRRTSGHGTVR